MKKTKIENDQALFSPDFLKEENIRAVDAKTRAQQIAFSPLSFQAIRAMLELGLLQLIEDSGDEGITSETLAEKAGIDPWQFRVLHPKHFKVRRLAKSKLIHFLICAQIHSDKGGVLAEIQTGEIISPAPKYFQLSVIADIQAGQPASVRR